MDPSKSVEEALLGCAENFRSSDRAGDVELAELTEKAVELLRSEDTREQGTDVLVGLRDKLHVARQMGNYVQAANLVEKIAGNFQHVDSYSLKSMCPILDQPDRAREIMKAMQEAEKAARNYEFLNSVEATEMTVNIAVPPQTKMGDVTVKLTASTLSVSVKGHERQPHVIEGTFFMPVDVDACDHHLEGSGEKRILVLDLEKQKGGMTWPDIFKYG